MLKINNISKSYKGKDILNKVNLEINKGDKIAIIGSNGTGKSTLIKIIAGKEEPDSGEIENFERKTIGYLPQEILIDDNEKRVDEYIKEYIGISDIERKMKLLEEDLEKEENLNEFCDLQQQYINLDGYNFDYKLEVVLNGLGLGNINKTKKIKELSGGQKSKVLLASVLLQNNDLLLLDEPTNNLDLKAIKWLEKYIKNLEIPCIIVSHDRKFLDNTTNKTVEIDFIERNIKEYTGNYTEYKKFKEKEEAKKIKEYEEQQEEIKNLRDSVQEKKDWAQKGRKQGVKDKDKYTRGYERDRSSGIASKAKAIEKKIEQMDKKERPRKREKLKFNIDYEKINGSTQISVNSLVCGYNGGFQTESISLDCNFGERIVIIGENGSGKSTFIKTLLGDHKPISGDISIGSGLKIGYIQQESQTKEDITIEEYMRDNCKAEKTIIYTTLDKFNFEYSDKDKEYKELSPGERTRLKLSTFALNNINTLVLDEPTNHLDIEALEALEEVLQTFNGTVISVTHDRYFIEKLVPDRILELKDGRFRRIEVTNIKNNKKEEFVR